MFDIGITLDTYQSKMIAKLVYKFDLNMNDIRCSSGRSIIFIKDNMVYQIYLSDLLFQTIVHNLKLISNMKGIVQYYHVYDKLNTVQYEKVEPIYNVQTSHLYENVNIDKLVQNVDNILTSLNKAQIVHGDFCCDNMGYSNIQKQYVLYDLETVRYMINDNDVICDQNRIKKSIKFCTRE